MSCNSCSNVTLPAGPAGPAGSNGAPGVDGVGITSIVFDSTTNPVGTAGVAGYIDTYRIEYTNGTTQYYDVANGNNGADGNDGVAVLDYRTADGGPFTGGVFYYPGIVQAAVSNLAVVQDAYANNLQTTIPPNTLQNVGDFLRVKLVVAVQNPESTLGAENTSFGAMEFSIWWDTTKIAVLRVGSLAKNYIGSQGVEAIVDIAMVDNTLITTGNVQTTIEGKWFDYSVIGLANAVSGDLLYNIVAKGLTLNETLSDPHTIYVKAENPNSTNGNIIDLEESSVRFSNDTGFVLSYEVIKYKKQV